MNFPRHDLDGEHGGWNVAGFTPAAPGLTAHYEDGSHRPVVGFVALEHVHAPAVYPETWDEGAHTAGTGRLRYVPAVLNDNYVVQPAQALPGLTKVA